LIPLRVGNTWVYSVYMPDSGGGEPIYGYEDTMSIIGVGKLGGEDYYLTDVRFAFRPTLEGLSVALYDGNDFGELEVLLRYPIADGTNTNILRRRSTSTTCW